MPGEGAPHLEDFQGSDRWGAEDVLPGVSRMVEAYSDAPWRHPDNCPASFNGDALGRQILQLNLLPRFEPAPNLDEDPAAAFIGDEGLMTPSPDGQRDGP